MILFYIVFNMCLRLSLTTHAIADIYGMSVEWLTEWMEIKGFNSDDEGGALQAALSNQLALQGLG